MTEEKKNAKLVGYLQTGALVILIVLLGAKMLFPGGALGSKQDSQLDPLAQIGLTYYLENYADQVGSQLVEAKVRDFGCHREIHIFTDGQLALKLVYYNRQVYVID